MLEHADRDNAVEHPGDGAVVGQAKLDLGPQPGLGGARGGDAVLFERDVLTKELWC